MFELKSEEINATGSQGMKEHYQYDKFLKIEDTPTFI